eukprot:353881_1
MATQKWTQETRNKSIISYYGIAIGYSFGKLSLELFYVFRVYKAFKYSVFALSKLLLIILICSLIIISFMWCFLFIISTINNLKWLASVVPHYLYLIISVAESLMVLCLLYIFSSRLSELLLRYRSSAKSGSKTRSDDTTVSSGKLPAKVIHPAASSGNNLHASAAESTTNATSITPRTSATFSNYPSTQSSQSISKRQQNVPTIKDMQISITDRQSKWIFLITRCILLSSISLITTIIFIIFAFY